MTVLNLPEGVGLCWALWCPPPGILTGSMPEESYGIVIGVIKLQQPFNK